MNILVLDDRLKPTARSFVGRRGKLMIDGVFVDAASGKTFPVYNPASATILTQAAEAGQEDVDRAVAAARQAFDDGPWRKLSTSERGQLLWKLAQLVEKNSEEFAEIEAIDSGKAITVARRVDVAWSIEMLRYMAGWATKITGQTIPFNRSGGDYFCYTTREPVGVVAQIIPFNFPLLIAVIKLAPALAAGCTTILKPAEQTPLSALRLGELILDAGFPPGVVNILTGGPATGAALASHGQVDAVAFTGSTAVGKKIVAAAAGNLKKVQLELGGKAPAIVFPDADLDRVIPGVSHGIFFNQGQTCCAGSRLFAHRKVFDRVLEGVCAYASRIRLGPGLDEKTEMGPLVSDSHASRVEGYVASGTQDGARIAVGGGRVNKDGGYYFAPTVLTETRPQMKVVQEEIFGPVLVAEPFDDDDLESIAQVGNDTVFGLSASVWTRDLGIAHKTSRMLKAGTIWINCHNVFDGGLPFGGFKQSGWGREMGFEVLHNYTEVKTTIAAL